MSLEVQTSSGKTDAKTAVLLNKYISNAVKLMGGKGLIESHKIANKMVKETDLNALTSQDVESKRAEIKKDLKQYGLREKMAYYSDADQMAKDENLSWLQKTVGATFITAAVLSCAGAEASVAAMGAGLAVVTSKVAMSYLGAPNNQAEATKNAEYADLKHAHLALKKLENALIKKENKEMTAEAMRKGVIFPISGRGYAGY